MSNTKRAVKGDIVRYVGRTEYDITNGRLYEIDTVFEHPSALGGTSYGAGFKDDVGANRAFWLTEKYEIVGKLEPTLKDIQGYEVKAGDTIAYAFAGGQSRHLGLFEVLSIHGKVAMCRSTVDGAVINLGVFEERAIIVK